MYICMYVQCAEHVCVEYTWANVSQKQCMPETQWLCLCPRITTFSRLHGGFPKWRVPQHAWFLMEIPFQMDDWWYPHDYGNPPSMPFSILQVEILGLRVSLWQYIHCTLSGLTPPKEKYKFNRFPKHYCRFLNSLENERRSFNFSTGGQKRNNIVKT